MALPAQPIDSSRAPEPLRGVPVPTDHRPSPGLLGTHRRRVAALTFLLGGATALYTVGLSASGGRTRTTRLRPRRGAQSWRGDALRRARPRRWHHGRQTSRRAVVDRFLGSFLRALAAGVLSPRRWPAWRRWRSSTRRSGGRRSPSTPVRNRTALRLAAATARAGPRGARRGHRVARRGRARRDAGGHPHGALRQPRRADAPPAGRCRLRAHPVDRSVVRRWCLARALGRIAGLRLPDQDAAGLVGSSGLSRGRGARGCRQFGRRLARSSLAGAVLLAAAGGGSRSCSSRPPPSARGSGAPRATASWNSPWATTVSGG